MYGERWQWIPTLILSVTGGGGGVYGYRASSAKSKGSNCLLESKQLLPLDFALHDAPGLTAVIVEACCTQSDRRHLKPQLRGERNSKPALTYSVCLFTELWIPDHCGLVYTDFSAGYAEGSLEVRFQSLYSCLNVLSHV